MAAVLCRGKPSSGGMADLMLLLSKIKSKEKAGIFSSFQVSETAGRLSSYNLTKILSQQQIIIKIYCSVFI